jgi:hypothetical protein
MAPPAALVFIVNDPEIRVVVVPVVVIDAAVTLFAKLTPTALELVHERAPRAVGDPTAWANVVVAVPEFVLRLPPLDT